MKNLLLIMMSALTILACGNGGKRKAGNTETSAHITDVKDTVDNATVYVYYFHGKQRCVTCNAVEKVTMEAIEEIYADNPDVKFQVLPTGDKENEWLVERYEITWNGLIIAKGDNSVNITRQAFANAVNNPLMLKELIKTEVNKRLSE